MKTIGISITCLFSIEVDDDITNYQIDEQVNKVVDDLVLTGELSNCINDVEWSELG